MKSTIATRVRSRVQVRRVVRNSPAKRLETALSCIKNARVRLQIRRIYEREIPTAAIFWDEMERQVELIANDWEIIIRERTDIPNDDQDQVRRERASTIEGA